MFTWIACVHIRSNDNYDTTLVTDLRTSCSQEKRFTQRERVKKTFWSAMKIDDRANGLEDSLSKLFFIPSLFNRLHHSGNENVLGSTHCTVGLNDKRKERTSPFRG